MRVLISGHDGYIGTVMSSVLSDAGHEVHGLDTYFFEGCTFGAERLTPPARRADVREVSDDVLAGVDAVVHLAALSNDPLGHLDPSLTHEINHEGTVRLARSAKAAGVSRFVFASSCSLYGVAGDGMLDESADFNPITPYGESKVSAEKALTGLADDGFSPTYMRNATAYGVSPRLRADVVVNNLVGYGCTTGSIVLQSDGKSWRPLVHVEDFSHAFLAVLEAPRELVHDQAFNVGRTSENYLIRDVAEIVHQAVPDCRVSFSPDSSPDPRSYKVDCSKLEALPGYRPRWTVEQGVAELVRAFAREEMTEELFFGSRYTRLKRIKELGRSGRLDDRLRWRTEGASKDEEVA